jgi:hypothetical protein
MSKKNTEKACPALKDENYEYHLSGNAYNDYCKCALTGNRCIGFVVEDPDDRSSQFFSRGKNVLDENKIKKCPVYGCSVETFKAIMKDRAEREFNEKMKQ